MTKKCSFHGTASCSLALSGPTMRWPVIITTTCFLLGAPWSHPMILLNLPTSTFSPLPRSGIHTFARDPSTASSTSSVLLKHL